MVYLKIRMRTLIKSVDLTSNTVQRKHSTLCISQMIELSLSSRWPQPVIRPALRNTQLKHVTPGMYQAQRRKKKVARLENRSSEHVTVRATGSTRRPCLSPSSVWSPLCICRRNAPPSCWTWRSSRWCSRCLRRRCRPCVGCTWPASRSWQLGIKAA